MPSLTFAVAGAYLAVFVLALLWYLATRVVERLRTTAHARPPVTDPPASMPALVVTLVHGTWARRAAWMAPGSPLCRTLLHATDSAVVFQRFLWSGGNSISARRRAVHALTQHLHSALDQWPYARHFIVAHSHGGNVAIQALVDPRLNSRVDGLVCLSTPFLTARRRDLGPVGDTVLTWLPVVVIFYAGAFAIQWAAPTYADTIGPVFLLLAIAGGLLLSRRLRRFGTSVLESLQYPTLDPAKVLILRAAADEASAALSAAHFVSWVTGRIWLVASNALGGTVDTIERWREALTRRRWAVVLAGAFLAFLTVITLMRLSADDPVLVQQALVAPAIALLLMIAVLARGGLVAALIGRIAFAALAAPFLMLIAALGVSLGPELLAAGLLFEITAEATPPGRWVVWQIPHGPHDPAEAPSDGLRHSASYQDPEALKILEAWFAAAASSSVNGSDAASHDQQEKMARRRDSR